mgnify:CR=1 FL=1
MTDKAKPPQPMAFKNLAELKRYIKLGTEFKATRHKYHPDIVGLTRVVTKVQTNGFYSKIKDEPNHRFSDCNGGKGFFTEFGKAGGYIFDGTAVKVLDKRGENGVIYELEFYRENTEVNEMNEYDRLHRQAQRYKELYEKIQKTKNGRNTQRNTDKTQDIFKLTVPVRCPSCGDRMRRRHDSRCKCQERWTCENKDCRLRIEISDAELLTALADLLGTVTADSIKMPAESPYEPSPEVIRLNNEISRMLDAAETDKAVLRSKMTKCLARKYKELDNGCCAVQRLKAELGSTADIAERLNRTVSEIRLYTDKTADIILLNGQIIRKESDNGTDCCIPAESGADNRTDNIGQRERENPLPSPAGGGILPRFH